MSITADELRGLVAHGLRGTVRRVHQEPQDAAREARLAYMREKSRRWRAANRERHRAYQKAYAAVNKGAVTARIKKWLLGHPAEAKAIRLRHRQKKTALLRLYRTALEERKER